MNIDFLLILVIITTICGLIALVDIVFWNKKRQTLPKDQQKRPFIIDNARSFFPMLLLVLLIRSFIGQPFWVPSESLEPTLLPGDFLLVSQFDYGVRVPIWHTKILSTGSPKRGDIVVFRWPVNQKLNLIKRVVGLPGDTISYENKVLTINGKVVPQTFIEDTNSGDSTGNTWPVKKYQENLTGKKHLIYVRPDRKSTDFHNLVVPKGMYFMMGDNRDDSDDSRYWGFMPESAIIGKAQLIFMSWKQGHFGFNWHRFGTML